MTFFNAFGAMTDQDIEIFLTSNHFLQCRKLNDGSWVGILELKFTWSVCCDIGPFSPFTYRWCFEDIVEALIFYSSIQEYDEIPSSRKSLKGHRYLNKPLLVEYDELGFRKW